MIKTDPKILLDYAAIVLPKKAQNLPLSSLDKAVEKTVESASKDSQKGLKSAMELIGRLMPKKRSSQELADYIAHLRAKGVDEKEIKYIIAHRCKSSI